MRTLSNNERPGPDRSWHGTLFPFKEELVDDRVSDISPPPSISMNPAYELSVTLVSDNRTAVLSVRSIRIYCMQVYC